MEAHYLESLLSFNQQFRSIFKEYFRGEKEQSGCDGLEFNKLKYERIEASELSLNEDPVNLKLQDKILLEISLSLG